MVERGFKQMLAEANAVIETMAVQDALAVVDDPEIVFVDVRETVELQESGAIPGAVHAPRGFLEFIVDPEGPMHQPVLASGKLLILYCGTGGRSALATKTLVDMGVTNVVSMAGGINAWIEADGPVDK